QEEIPFQRKTFDGKNWQRLVEDINASDYDLVVLGAQGHGTAREDVLGSVCARIVRRVRTDTLVIKTREPFEDTNGARIVTAVDGSAESFGGLQAALSLAKAFGKPVEAVATYDPYFHYGVFHRMVSVLSEEVAQVFRFKEQERLHEEIIDAGLARIYQSHLEVARRVAEEEGVELSTTLLAGRPDEEILRHLRQENTWLLVAGRTGVHSDEAMDIGSNTENLLRLAPCNVLIASRRFTPPVDVRAQEMMIWTEESQQMLNRVPPQHRGLVRTLVHRLALEGGDTVITAGLVEKAVRTLAPSREQRQFISAVAHAVAVDALRKEGGTIYLCQRCGYTARQVQPALCPICKAGGEQFLAVSQAVLEDIALAQGGATEETAFDGRRLRWSKAAKQALDSVADPHRRRRARLRIEKAARLSKHTLITLELALPIIREAAAHAQNPPEAGRPDIDHRLKRR
ncbi:MAG: universal stress protein, partial [Dehalococcoidia bacterium]